MINKTGLRRMEFEKGTRYYALLLQQDLWGAWLLTRIWGGKGRGRQQKDELCGSYEQALGRMEELALYRQRQRKYSNTSQAGSGAK